MDVRKQPAKIKLLQYSLQSRLISVQVKRCFAVLQKQYNLLIAAAAQAASAMYGILVMATALQVKHQPTITTAQVYFLYH